jgi:hypothetical protein
MNNLLELGHLMNMRFFVQNYALTLIQTGNYASFGRIMPGFIGFRN